MYLIGGNSIEEVASMTQSNIIGYNRLGYISNGEFLFKAPIPGMTNDQDDYSWYSTYSANPSTYDFPYLYVRDIGGYRPNWVYSVDKTYLGSTRYSTYLSNVPGFDYYALVQCGDERYFIGTTPYTKYAGVLKVTGAIPFRTANSFGGGNVVGGEIITDGQHYYRVTGNNISGDPEYLQQYKIFTVNDLTSTGVFPDYNSGCDPEYRG
jgi:hypothetical protein